jgi:hypothetical protein
VPAETSSPVQAAANLAEPRPLAEPHEPFEEPPTDRTQLPMLDTDRNIEPSAPAAELKTPDTDRKLTVPPASQPRLTPLKPTSPAQRPPLPPLRPPVRPAAAGARPATGQAAPRQPSSLGARRPAVVGGAKPSAEGVLVARPAVIVGGGNAGAPTRPPSQTARVQPGRSSGRWHPVNNPQTAPPAPHEDKQDNIFGGDLISEKSLDEVILAYLSEDLNDK